MSRTLYCLFILSLSLLLARATSLLEEAFPYATGNLNAQGGWSGGSGSQVIAGSLTYPGLQSPTITSNKASMPVTASTAFESFNAVAISNGSVYLSFILKQTTLTTSTIGGTLAGLDDDGAATTSNGKVAAALGIHIKQTNATNYLVGIRKGQGAAGSGGGADIFYTGDSFTTNEVVFIVARYTFGAGAGDDTVTLWVNPPTNSFAGIEPVASIAATTTTNTVDATELQYVFVRCNSSTTSGANEIDDMRVGTTWADVTPTGGPAAPTSVPVITQALLVPQGMVLRGTNGTPAGVYQVLASTNVTLPLTNWPSVAAHAFDLSGNFDSTNPVVPNAAQQFFRLLVGGTIPPANTAPSITNPPQSLTLAVGQTANFLVGADGTAPLDYFWSLNTNTPVGGNSSTLSLVGITTNNVGSYRVIVSNSVGTATSTVATLTVLVLPAITTDPTNLTVVAGSSAAFSVTATGSAPLRYQWYFNTNTALANATNTTLALNPVHATNAGTYSVIVTNSVGAATSSVATLNVLAPPSITAQPQPQAVTVSNTATFTVTAAGTAPLVYQWRFNTNTPVGVNSNAFTLLNAQTNNAGGYSVIVTNNYGAITSTVAALTVNPPSAAPDFSMVGFAALDGFASNDTLQAGGTTGGTGGALVLVSNLTDLVKYLQTNTTLRVQIQNDISLSNLANHHGGFPAGYPTGEILVNSNKTIFSTNGATISRGSFRIGKAANGKQNIIIRNLKFRDLWVYDPSGNYDTYGWDYIGLEGGSHHVWVDHCDFDQVYDGMLDIVHASDYVTASWNIFRTQKKCSLIGHSDSNASEDTGHLNVTFHHNYYVDVEERMPRMRFGNAHVFNLYSENLGGNGIQSTCAAAVLVENSHFQFPQSGSLPTRQENGGPTGTVKVVNCVISNLPSVNVQFIQYGQSNFLFNAPFVGATPPYSYTNVMHPVSQVPNIVTNWSGVGKLTSF